MRKYQQGDVLFNEVPEDQWKFEDKNVDILDEDTKFFNTSTISVMRPTKINEQQWAGIVEEKDRLEK